MKHMNVRKIDAALKQFIYETPFTAWDLSILYEILNANILYVKKMREELQKNLDAFFCPIFLIRKSLLAVSFVFSSLSRLKGLEHE